MLPSRLIRQWVSKKRKRYIQHGYDLDLTYITERLIAMSYPAENMEAVYRNPMWQVQSLLDLRHNDKYKVYNLCSEGRYDPVNFKGRVELLPFDDHHTPPIAFIKTFCESVFQWLGQDTQNVAVIHCRAGKGRTGLMICCFLVYSTGMSPDEALRFYAEKRTTNNEGVTVASQRRYVHYWRQVLGEASASPVPRPIQLPEPTPRTLRRIRLYDAISTNRVDFTVSELTEMPGEQYWPPVVKSRGECLALKRGNQRVVSMRYWLSKLPEDVDDSDCVPLGNPLVEHSPKWIVQMDTERDLASKRPFLDHYFSTPLPIMGDICVTFFDTKGRQMFFTCFNTSFITNGMIYLTREQLDKMGTKASTLFGRNFSLELLFGAVQPPSPGFNGQYSSLDEDSFS